MNAAPDQKNLGVELDREVITPDDDPEQRFRLYRLCPCKACSGTGKSEAGRCPECRGEGRTRELVASCGTEEAVGVALVTCAREGEFEDCPIGLLDKMGETGKKWLILPWQPSPREVSEAGRILAKSKTEGRK